jgi:hypothetical protein
MNVVHGSLFQAHFTSFQRPLGEFVASLILILW